MDYTPNAFMLTMLDNPHWVKKVRETTSELGRYQVRYEMSWGPARLYSFRTVDAPSREEAIAGVIGGVDAEVMQWSKHDPEIAWTREQLGM